MTSEENQNKSSLYVLPPHYYDRHTKTSSKLPKVAKKFKSKINFVYLLDESNYKISKSCRYKI